MKGEPYFLTKDRRSNMLLFMRMFTPEIHRALLKIDFPPSVFNIIWFYYVKGVCLCNTISMSEIDYLLKKTVDEGWEFRCTYCKCLALLYNVSRNKNVNLDDLRVLIDSDNKELTRIVGVKEPFRFLDNATDISVIRI